MFGRNTGSLRWWIAIILAGSVALNYLDRQTLSILVETIQKSLRFSDLQYSYITAVFLTGYTVMTAVSGRLLDRIGTRKGLAAAVVLWSAAICLHPLCTTVLQFGAARLLLGIGESANFPAGVKAIAERFPLKERAFAIGIFNSGSSIGAAIGAPLISLTAIELGWRWTFVLSGMLGFVWLAVFLSVYREDSGPVNVTSDVPEEREEQVSVFGLLRQQRSWGCFAARIFIDPVTYFLIFWVPKFLEAERGFSLADVGRFLWAPYLALAVGTVAGGYIPDRLVGWGWTVNRARKSMMFVASTVILICCIVIVDTRSSATVLIALGLFMFAHGAWGNIAVPAEVFKSNVVGTIAGLGGMFGGVAGIAGQVMIGHTLLHHSFSPIFLCAGSLYLVAFLALCLFIRNLGQPASLLTKDLVV